MKRCSLYLQGLCRWTRALRTLFVYTEFTEKKVFEQLMLADVSSAGRHPASGEVLISECDVARRWVVGGLLLKLGSI